MEKKFYFSYKGKHAFKPDTFWVKRSTLDYVIQNYFQFKDPRTGKLVNWKPDKSQRSVINDILSNKFTVISKPRQIGMSTLLQAVAALQLGFQKSNNLIAYACWNQNMIDVCRDKVLEFIKGLQNFEKNMFPATEDGTGLFDIVRHNRDLIELRNGNKIKFFSLGSNTLFGGQQISLYILDEPDLKQVKRHEHSIFPIVNTLQDVRVVIATNPHDAERISEEIPMDKKKIQASFYPFRQIKGMKITKFYAAPELY